MNEDATEVRLASSTPSAAESRFTPGTMLAERYRIVSHLGAGGMGDVYRADDVKLGQRVALKHVDVQNAGALDRLYAEVRVGRQIAHPNVCRLYDVVEAGGQRFIAMEFVDGEDLASLLRRIGRLPSEKALMLARDICAGLAAAHDRGFVHRDLKPANIMVDGRGTARLTDFGLAAAAGDHVSGFAGTPAYMAPEQLDGGVATVRSDIYALGLVLYETFTGRRVFDAPTLEGLRTQHAASRTRPSSIVSEIDPAVERVILRCLEEDPRNRPASARAVLAELPGGDPLQDAIDAGETPSPEMVAAAGQAGDLTAGRAWRRLLLLVVLLCVCIPLSHYVNRAWFAFDVKAADAYRDRGLSIARALGYDERPADAAGFYTVIASTPHYVYRDSPRLLVARGEAVTTADPPLTVPGMTSVLLDAEGRLREFLRVPASSGSAAAATPQWDEAFRQAGLDPARFRETEPHAIAPVGSAKRWAWVSTDPASPLRIEAASAFGRPVWFRVGESTLPPPRGSSFGQHVMAALQLLAWVFGGAFARRNVRRGRADVRGAIRVGAFAAIAYLVARLFLINHVPDLAAEWSALRRVIGSALATGALSWLAYLAVEPYVRRRSPHILVGWTRLVSGRLRDPLVGQDVLFGLTGGAATYAMLLAVLGVHGLLVPSRVRIPFALMPFFYELLSPIATAILYVFGWLVLLVLFRLLVRNDALAYAMIVIVGASTNIRGSDALLSILAGIMILGPLILVLRLRGVLAAATATFCYYALVKAPLTLEFGTWYAQRGLAVTAILAACGLWGFRVALAGKPLFGNVLAEGEFST